jgi:hypothetical protein
MEVSGADDDTGGPRGKPSKTEVSTPQCGHGDRLLPHRARRVSRVSVAVRKSNPNPMGIEVRLSRARRAPRDATACAGEWNSA